MRGRSIIRGRTALFFLFIMLLGAAAVFVDLPTTPGIHIGGYNNNLTVNQGLDLQGGIQLTMEATCPQGQKTCDFAKDMPSVIDNVNRRISGGLGLNDAVVRQLGGPSGSRILIELPGLKDDKQALDLIGKTGQMNIIDTGTTQLPVGTTVQPGQYKVVFTGAQLNSSSISAMVDSQSGQPVVTFAFSGDAKTKFGDYTRQHLQQFLTITLDNQVIESAVIQSEIDGPGQISGLPSITDAQNLASLLKYGALPLPLHVASEQQLAPTLGQQALDYSKRAAFIGLGMVVLFMLIYYRLPGLLADVALLLYALFLFAVIKLLGVTLSLPGIAAVILTIGMAVDANVLIFERVKEELRGGRTMASAIDIGFKRAWPSIRDSNASTMITCGILYLFGDNFGATLIVGFAINLFIGVALSLFTAVVVTRNFLNLLVPTGIATHPALYGLPPDALNIPRYNRPKSRVAAQPSRAAVRAEAADNERDEDEDEDERDDEAPADETSAQNGRVPTSRHAGASHGAEE